MAFIPRAVYKQAFIYALPLFFISILCSSSVRMHSPFWYAIPSSIVTSFLPSKSALLLSSLISLIPILFPSLYYISYGAAAGQAYTSHLLGTSHQLDLNELVLKLELLGLFIAHQLELPYYFYFICWSVILFISFVADPPAAESSDPYLAMRKLICGNESQTKLNETELLIEPVQVKIENKQIKRKGVDEDIDGKEGNQVLLLAQEYRAYFGVHEDETKSLLRFIMERLKGRNKDTFVPSGIFHVMFLSASNPSLLLVFLFFQVCGCDWPVIIILFLELIGIPWEWLGLFTRIRSNRSISIELLYGWILYKIIGSLE